MSYCKGLTKQYKKIAKHSWANGLIRKDIPKDLVDYSIVRTDGINRDVRLKHKDKRFHYQSTAKP